jgi:hypothetical protein
VVKATEAIDACTDRCGEVLGIAHICNSDVALTTCCFDEGSGCIEISGSCHRHREPVDGCTDVNSNDRSSGGGEVATVISPLPSP